MIRYLEGMSKPPRGPIVTERERTIGVRVSPKEYEAIQRRADAVGLRVASYVRLLALQDTAPSAVEQAAAIAELTLRKALKDQEAE